MHVAQCHDSTAILEDVTVQCCLLYPVTCSLYSGIANAELNSVVHDNSIQTYDLVEPEEPVSQTLSATTPVSCVELPQVTPTSSKTSAELLVDAELESPETVRQGDEDVDAVDNIPVEVEELKHRNPVIMQQLMLAIIVLVVFFIVLAAIVVIIFDVDAVTSLLDSVFHSYGLDQFDFLEALFSFINKCSTWLCGVFRFHE